jgi:malate synthase
VVYGNWLGLMKGDLSERFEKGGETLTRTPEPGPRYTGADGGELTLHGRSLLFVRNVGHLMTNDAILDAEGREIPEGIMDAMFTSLIALHDPQGHGRRCATPARQRVHRQTEDARPGRGQLHRRPVRRVEDALGMARNTLKLGIMDEERRTTVNLKECIRRARERVVFINTGFLDRTGDEIHTSMAAGAMTPKGDMKGETWIRPTRTTTSTWAWPAACRAARRSARACGPCRT